MVVGSTSVADDERYSSGWLTEVYLTRFAKLKLIDSTRSRKLASVRENCAIIRVLREGRVRDV